MRMRAFSSRFLDIVVVDSARLAAFFAQLRSYWGHGTHLRLGCLWYITAVLYSEVICIISCVWNENCLLFGGYLHCFLRLRNRNCPIYSEVICIGTEVQRRLCTQCFVDSALLYLFSWQQFFIVVNHCMVTV